MHHLTFQSCNLARSRPVRKRSDGGNACLFRHFTERASKFPQQKAYRFLRRVVCYVTFLLFSGSCSRAFALSAHEAFGRKNFFETSRFSPTANAPPPLPTPCMCGFKEHPLTQGIQSYFPALILGSFEKGCYVACTDLYAYSYLFSSSTYIGYSDSWTRLHA